MKVSELMHTPAVVCSVKRSVGEAARQMAARDVGCLILVDQVGELAGIVTDRDIALRGAGQGHSADVPVETIMTRDVATVSPYAAIETAAAIMQKRAVRRLPVVDDDGHLHGLIAMDDLMRHVGETVDTLTDTLFEQRLHRV